MKRGKLSQLSCRADDVAKLAFCVADSNANPACGQPAMTLMVRAERELIDVGQLAPGPAPLTPAQQHAKAEDDDAKILQPKF